MTSISRNSTKSLGSQRCERQRLSRQAKLCFAESMHAPTAMIENGSVQLPDTAPWLAQYLHELTAFPNGPHADPVDSTAQMLDWFKHGAGPAANAGIYELYRIWPEEAREKQARRERRVRLRSPRGIGHMNTLLPNVAADGTVEMPEEQAESFLRAGWVRVDDQLGRWRVNSGQ